MNINRALDPDLHLRNLLLQLPSPIDGLSVEQLHVRFSELEKHPVILISPRHQSSTNRPISSILRGISNVFRRTRVQKME
ncbi:hypothetical protein E4U52_004515 [Claviceps spartinae]|nr:hypothetical protein E4U52_004515 [Claviceps spartinae]